MASTDAATSSWASAHARTVVRRPGRSSPGHSVPGVSTAGSFPMSIDRVIDWTTPSPSHSAVTALACTIRPDGQLVMAAGQEDGYWEVRDAKARIAAQNWPFATNPPIRSVALTAAPDGRVLLAIVNLDTVEVHELFGESEERMLLEEATPERPPQIAAWTGVRGGHPLLAVGGQDGRIQVWDGEAFTWHNQVPGHPGTVTAVAWADGTDGQAVVITASRDRTVRATDAHSGKLLHVFNDHPDSDAVLTCAQSSAAPLTVASGGYGKVVVRDGLDGGLLIGLDQQAGQICSLASATVGRRVVLAAVDASQPGVLVWDPRDDEKIRVLPDSTEITQVAMASEGDEAYLAAGDRNGRLSLLRLKPASAASPAATPASAAHSGQISRRAAARADPLSAAVGVELAVNEVDHGELTSRTDEPATTVACTSTPGGPMIVTGSATGAVRVWDGTTGELQRTFDHSLTGMIKSVACATLPDGGLLIAACDKDSGVGWHYLSPAAVEFPIMASMAMTGSVACVTRPTGELLVAFGGKSEVRIWDGNFNPAPRSRISGIHARSVAWTVLRDGRVLLAVGGPSGTHVYDGIAGGRLHSCGTTAVNTVAWAPDEPSLLVTGDADGEVLVWDGARGTLLHTRTEHSGPVYSIAWMVTSEGRRLMATSGRYDQKTTQIWDGQTFNRLARLPGTQGTGGNLAWARAPDGQTWLAATPGMSQQRVRIWNISPGKRQHSESPASTNGNPAGIRPAEAGLFALGRADLWLPLGLIADLVTLTGPARPSELNDRRLQILAEHPGIQRLRSLGWSASARLSFAGLLGQNLTPDAEYVPPERAPSDSLHAALNAALANDGPVEPASVSVDDLAATAHSVTDRTLALLTILGPATVAADPALPLRLAAHAPQLPVMTESQLRHLGDSARIVSAGRETAGQLRHAPGTAGIGRNGNLSHMLLSQLALPTDVLAARLLQDQLLYRRNTARIPSTPGSVTLILDSTPPTYGPPETCLRLVAHLITVALWKHGEQPTLISLAQPEIATVLASSAQLTRLWTTRTLEPPGPAIAVALETAAHVGTPTVLLCHHHAPGRHYNLTPGRRLLTTHQPAEPAPPPPSHPNHHHLPPDPSQDQLTEAIWALFAPAAQWPGSQREVPQLIMATSRPVAVT